MLVIPLGPAAIDRALSLAQALRRDGIGTEVAFGGRRLRSELERAHRLGASIVLILGDDELRDGVVTLRDMTTGQQRPVALADVPGELHGLRSQGGQP